MAQTQLTVEWPQRQQTYILRDLQRYTHGQYRPLERPKGHFLKNSAIMFAACVAATRFAPTQPGTMYGIDVPLTHGTNQVTMALLALAAVALTVFTIGLFLVLMSLKLEGGFSLDDELTGTDTSQSCMLVRQPYLKNSAGNLILSCDAKMYDQIELVGNVRGALLRTVGVATLVLLLEQPRPEPFVFLLAIVSNYNRSEKFLHDAHLCPWVEEICFGLKYVYKKRMMIFFVNVMAFVTMLFQILAGSLEIATEGLVESVFDALVSRSSSSSTAEQGPCRDAYDFAMTRVLAVRHWKSTGSTTSLRGSHWKCFVESLSILTQCILGFVLQQLSSDDGVLALRFSNRGWDEEVDMILREETVRRCWTPYPLGRFSM